MQVSDLNSSVSVFALNAERYIEKLLSPLPIVPGEKRPCIKEWDYYCDHQPEKRDILSWAQAFPGAGLGVALGTVIDKATDSRLISADIDQDDLVEQVKAQIFRNQQGGWKLFIGKQGKRGITVFARSIGLLPGQKISNGAGMAVELLSRGQQTVIPPTIHPNTGEPYRWLSNHTLLNADLMRLPVITPELWQRIKFAVSSPIGGTHPEGTQKIRYLGEGRFEGVEMVYPGNVNDTQWKMAWAAAWYNFNRHDDSVEGRNLAVEGMVEAATEAYKRSGSKDVWDQAKQWQEAASQYDRQFDKLQMGLRTRAAVASDYPIDDTLPSRQALHIIKPAEFHGKPLPERKWLVEGWVPYGEVVSLYGDGGIGKSLLSLQLMAACALGKPWLGLKTMSCSTFGLFCEDDRDELLRRTADITKVYGAELRDLGDRMTFVSRIGEDNFLMTFVGEGYGRPTELSKIVKDYLAEHKPGLIVVDTAADTFGGNEIIRLQVRQFVAQGLGSLARAAHGTVLLCAHPSRAGLTDGSGTGGSTAWNNSVRARLFLHKVDGESKQRLLSRMKANYSPMEGENIPLDWKNGAFIRLDGASVVLNRIQAKEAFMAALEASGEQLSPVPNSAYYAPKALAASPDVHDFSVTQLAAAMNDLVREGALRVEQIGPKSKLRKVLVRVAPPAVGEVKSHGRELPGVSPL